MYIKYFFYNFNKLMWFKKVHILYHKIRRLKIIFHILYFHDTNVSIVHVRDKLLYLWTE